MLVCGGWLPPSWDPPRGCSKPCTINIRVREFQPPKKQIKSGGNFRIIQPFEGVRRKWRSLSLEKFLHMNLYKKDPGKN